MNTWILVLLVGISWAGPGGVYKTEFDSKEDCFEALKMMRISGNGQVAGEDDEQVVAYCKPKNN